MLKNYLTIALRNILNNKLYTFINVLGLGLGLACCVLIYLYVTNELKYDKHFSQAENIHRVQVLFSTQHVDSREARVSYRYATPLKQDFSEILLATRLIPELERTLLVNGEKQFYEDKFFFADDNFFQVFDYHFIEGDPSTALSEPLTVVLTEKIAKKYFGDESPIGQTILFRDEHALTVTGVIEDLPTTTHMTSEFIASASSMITIYGEEHMDEMGGRDYSWDWGSSYTYLLLKDGVDPDALEAKFKDFSIRHNAIPDVISIYLQPLLNIHLHSNIELEMKANGDVTTVYAFSMIAILILLIACLNFINLSTAKTTQRAKEISMRKVLGASRGQIIKQFLGESTLMACIALIIALSLLEIMLPAFNSFMGKSLFIDYQSNPSILFVLLGLIVIVGLGAGSYPAFYLSKPSPIAVLRTLSIPRGGSLLIRKILVIVQFTISLMLIISTAVIHAQIKYAKSMDLGYNKDHILVVSDIYRLDQSYEAFQNSLLPHSQIHSAAVSDLVPTNTVFSGGRIAIVGQPADSEPPFFRFNPIGFDFFKTYKIPIVTGRAFDRAFTNDVYQFPTPENPHTLGAVIINEAAARKVGWSAEEAIGKQFIQSDDESSITYDVIGVAKDIHYGSIHNIVEPLMYVMSTNPLEHMGIRLSGQNIAETLTFIDEKWQEHLPEYPINYSFLDAQFDALYNKEEVESKILIFFSSFAIFVSCLGLLGLACFTTERRTREIGVRKVMGASIWDVVLLLNWDFSKLVVVANIFAWPLAYYVAQQWLSNFAYQVDIQPVLFLAAALLAFVIAWLTVGINTWQVARTKPALFLRDE